MITVRYFAAAAEAAGADSQQLDAGSTRELRAAILAAHGDDLARVLDRCTLLVAGRRAAPEEDVPLSPGAVVDVLPPFAGG